MIEKIIANGQSGAALAALDVAVKLGLNHEGWCGTEDAVADRYKLEQISGASYQTLLNKAVDTSDGTVYFSRTQQRSIELEKNKKTASERNKPILLVDLNQDRGFSVSRRIAVWINDNQIRVLHVDGEKIGKNIDPMTNDVMGILEATFFLTMMDTGVTSPLQSIVQRERFPQATLPSSPSVEAALDHLDRSLSLKDKATIANMVPEELISLHFTLGEYINTQFELFTTNHQLLADCRRIEGQKELAPKDAAAVIIQKLWERLRETYRIRIIK